MPSKDTCAFKEELSEKTLELMLFREMVLNQDFLSRLESVVDMRWFKTPHIRLMAQFAVLYHRKYGATLTRDLVESFLQHHNEKQVIESNKVDLNAAIFDFNKAKDLDLGGMSDTDRIAKIQGYVKQEAMRNALLDSATNLETKNADDIVADTLRRFEDIQKMVFEQDDLGTELSSAEVEESVDEHMEYLTNPAARLPTGWACVDDITHGGFLKDGKSLYIFMAQAGLGKSNILANLGYNFLKQDMKVLVVSMEMSQNVYLRRFDSLISKIDIDDLGISSMARMLRDRLVKFFKMEHPRARLNVKEFPPGSKSARDIESYIDKLVEKKGWKPDVVLVDYLNLIKPNYGSAKGDSTMYEDGKVVSEELRALSYKFEIPVISAVQCNSSGFNTADIGMENIAQSRGIAHTADFIAGLYQTEDEQADGIFHMKILKSRLGDKGNMKFEFNKDTMEFRDINDVSGPETQKSKMDSGNVSEMSVDDIDKALGEDFGFPGELGMP